MELPFDESWASGKHHQRKPRLDVNAPPFDRNPSAWDQRIPVALLSAIGFGISAYLALFQWGLVDSVYDPIFGEGSEKVLTSDASKRMHHYMRMPDAALGALAYLGDGIFGMAGSTRRWQYRPWMVLLFGIDVIPLGIVSVILVVTQGAVIGSWCFLCLMSAVVSIALIGLAYDEVWASITYLRRVFRATHDWGMLWDAFLGRPHAVFEEVARSDWKEEPHVAENR